MPCPLGPIPALPRYFQDLRAKRAFVRSIFDDNASDYDTIEHLMALGSGGWYRRQALRRAGLAPGMRMLDVAVGTGMVARQAVAILGAPDRVVGVDVSAGMLRQALAHLPIGGVLGAAEQLPFADGSFDFVSMGYALRHVADLSAAFAEFRRVLRPGSRLCILEITRPASRLGTAALKLYMKRVIPTLGRMTTRKANNQRLWEYYWDTIEACVAPQQVLQAIADAGFADIGRHVELGIFTEYTARIPKRPSPIGGA